MKLEEYVIYAEINDKSFLHELGKMDFGFTRYGYHAGGVISNNLGLQYRHVERVESLIFCFKDCKKLLDVGRGYGDILLEMANKEKDVVGIDISVNCLKIAQTRLQKHKLIGSVVRCDAHNLPFTEHFDAAYCSQVVEHLENPYKVINEMLRVAPKVAFIHLNNESPLLYMWYLLNAFRPPEQIPRLNVLPDAVYFINFAAPSNNRTIVKLSLFLSKFIRKVPVLRTLLAGNVIKVFTKS